MSLRSYLHSTFDPRRIPGLQAWYDAADSASITLDAGRVSQWSDKSGLGRHATNTTSGSTQPSYTAAGRNGLNVLSFAAASVQRLSVPSSTATFKFLHDGTPCYWIAVSSYGASSDPNAIYGLFGNCAGGVTAGAFFAYDDRSTLGNNAANVGVFNAGVTTVVNTLNATNAAFVTNYNDLLLPQTYLVQEAVLDVGNSTVVNRLKFLVNGGSEASANNKTAAPTASNAGYNMQIGALGNNAIPLQGDICELMFFSQQPTAAARDLIRRYLGAKWGVSVG